MGWLLDIVIVVGLIYVLWITGALTTLTNFFQSVITFVRDVVWLYNKLHGLTALVLMVI